MTTPWRAMLTIFARQPGSQPMRSGSVERRRADTAGPRATRADAALRATRTSATGLHAARAHAHANPHLATSRPEAISMVTRPYGTRLTCAHRLSGLNAFPTGSSTRTKFRLPQMALNEALLRSARHGVWRRRVLVATTASALPSTNTLRVPAPATPHP